MKFYQISIMMKKLLVKWISDKMMVVISGPPSIVLFLWRPGGDHGAPLGSETPKVNGELNTIMMSRQFFYSSIPLKYFDEFEI